MRFLAQLAYCMTISGLVSRYLIGPEGWDLSTAALATVLILLLCTSDNIEEALKREGCRTFNGGWFVFADIIMLARFAIVYAIAIDWPVSVRLFLAFLIGEWPMLVSWATQKKAEA